MSRRETFGLAFWADDREAAEREARDWADHEPHVRLVAVERAVEVRHGRWDVFVTVESKRPFTDDDLTLGLVPPSPAPTPAPETD